MCVCVGLRVENKRIGDKLVEMRFLVVEATGVVKARLYCSDARQKLLWKCVCCREEIYCNGAEANASETDSRNV